MWDVTPYAWIVSDSFSISTHTSRVGCDLLLLCQQNPRRISTHTSRVGCDGPRSSVVFLCFEFLLSHPVWDVTLYDVVCVNSHCISTHTSRVGCDVCGVPTAFCNVDFYSHIPCGMWPITCGRLASSGLFLLTHPVWDVTAIYSIFQSHYSHILQDGPIIHLELY